MPAGILFGRWYPYLKFVREVLMGDTPMQPNGIPGANPGRGQGGTPGWWEMVREFQFGYGQLSQMAIAFDPEFDGDAVRTEAGTLSRRLRGYRFRCSLGSVEVEAAAISEIYRLLGTWPYIAGERKHEIWLTPHPDVPMSFRVLPAQKAFDHQYWQGRFVGYNLLIEMVAQELIDEVPTYVGYGYNLYPPCCYGEKFLTDSTAPPADATYTCFYEDPSYYPDFT